mgnify:CR=1 FL=1
MGDLDPTAPVSPSARRIGVLGGTFDPVHIGHLRGALEVAESLNLDELRLTPSARPPHRDTPQVSALDRLAMVECAVAGVAPLVVDDRELKRDKLVAKYAQKYAELKAIAGDAKRSDEERDAARGHLQRHQPVVGDDVLHQGALFFCRTGRLVADDRPSPVVGADRTRLLLRLLAQRRRRESGDQHGARGQAGPGKSWQTHENLWKTNHCRHSCRRGAQMGSPDTCFKADCGIIGTALFQWERNHASVPAPSGQSLCMTATSI